ncbi:MAG: ribosome recycling factor [Patescibacteria group bacterium]|jgi:ribosome recycling factor
MIADILKDADVKMSASIVNLKSDLTKIRTGRAQGSLVEDILVSYYGMNTSLKELASISVPEASLIQIKPFDRNSLGDIETAIRNADLGLTPVNDGTFVRLSLPPITEERRIELSKQVKKTGEEAKVSLRTIRGDAWSRVQGLIKNNEATEDDKYQAEKDLNELIERKNKEVDLMITEKESEVMKI